MTVELAETREPSDLGRIGRLMLSQAARWRLAWVLVVVSLLVSYIGWGWHGLTGVPVLVVGGLYMSAHVEHFWPDVHAELVAPLRRIGWLAWLWYRWWPTVKGGGFARRERVMTDASDRVTWYGPRLRGLRVIRHGIRLAVRPPDGKTVEDIAKLGEALRDSMKADAVEVDARTRPGKLVVSLVMRSPLRDMRPLVGGGKEALSPVAGACALNSSPSSSPPTPTDCVLGWSRVETSTARRRLELRRTCTTST